MLKRVKSVANFFKRPQSPSPTQSPSPIQSPSPTPSPSPARSDLQRTFYHLICTDEEAEERFCSSTKGAQAAINELSAFSWDYKERFFTEMSLRAMGRYQRTHQRDALWASVTFSDW